MIEPTLILGAEPRIAVTVARSLSKHKIKVTVAALGGGAKKIRSRAVHQFVFLPDPHDEPVQFWSALRALIHNEQFDFLIPCGDSALVATCQFYDQLERLLRVSSPPPHVIERVLDKRLTLEAARQCGVPIPATFHLSSLAEIEAVGSRLVFPIVCKPPNKQKENAYKVRYFCSYEELRTALTSGNWLGEEVLLQQYCEGEGIGVEALMHMGAPVALFQHRRLRELPSTGGASVLAVSEQVDADLAQLAVTLLRNLQWEGVAMVEFKCNRAKHTAVLMEVNGRYWGSLSLAIHAGVDFPVYEWQLAHREAPQIPAHYKIGLRTRWLTGDVERLHEVLLMSRSEKASRWSRWRELADFVTDFGPSTRDMLWSMRDPLPGLLEFICAMKQLTIGAFKRLVKSLLPAQFIYHVRAVRSLRNLAGRTYLKLLALRVLGIRKARPIRIQSRVSSVLFVCHGNIIRSPLAAALLKRHLSALGQNSVHVWSAGLHAKPGRGADERACQLAKEIGISLNDHRARPLTASLVEQADLVFVMDALNEAQLLTLCPDAEPKVFLLPSDLGGHGSDEVVDPFHGSVADVRHCIAVLQSRTARLASMLLQPG